MGDQSLVPTPSYVTGPVWQRYEDGSFHLPDKTLGWGVINWLYKFIRQPGGEHAGQPFLPTDEQARFIVWWYAVDPCSGRFVYRSGMLRRMKGWGKDPLAAALALAELCGPVRFSHWDKNGDPVGKPCPNPWVSVTAVSLDQTKNTFRMFPIMISKQLKEFYGLEVNKFVIYSKAGGLLEGVTSAPHSMEGNRPTFVIKNETQWWKEANDGHEMANVIKGNVAKAPFGGCRSLSIANAHRPGEDSDAERDHDYANQVAAGKAIDTGFLYDALEAPPDTPIGAIPSPKEDPIGFEAGIEKLRRGIEVVRGDAYWIDVDTIVQEILDNRTRVSELRRLYLNQVNAAEDSWISPMEWDSDLVRNPNLRLQPGDQIALGFDGSKSNDCTAIVACRISDGALFKMKVWDPRDCASGEIPREDVDSWVHRIFDQYKVVAFRADVKEFEAYVDQWSTKYKRVLKVKASPNNPVAFDMRGNQKRFAFDCERFLDAVLEGELTHNGDRELREHILNAKNHPTKWEAVSIRKASKDSSRKIDAAVCAVLAFGARYDYLMSTKNRSGKVVIYK